MNTFKYKKISTLLEKNGIDLSYDGTTDIFCGEIIASGVFTAVVDLDYLHIKNFEDDINHLKDPVLILTTEPHKKDLISSVLGSEFVVDIDIQKNIKQYEKEWLFENGFDSIEEAEEEGFYFNYLDYISEEEFNIYPWLDYLNSEYYIYYFFTEKLEKYDIKSSEIDVSKELLNNFFPVNDQIHSSYFEYVTFDSSKLYSLIKTNIKENKHSSFYKLRKLGKREEIKRGILLFKIVMRDIVKASKSLSSIVRPDIHLEQFVLHNGQPYCIDPFYEV